MKTETVAAGFVGLGAMGEGMARNLHRAGCLHRVWNRSPGPAIALSRELGVVRAADLPALGRECEVIVLCVSADDDVLEVIESLLPGLAPGKLVIDTSTVNPGTARSAADRLAGAGAGFLDAPVSGGVEGARKGTLAMMVGGDPSGLARARTVLEAMAARIELMGPVGSGQATKAVNQVMAAGIDQAVSEALAFAEALELPMQQVMDVVGSGAAGNWFLSHRGPGMVAGCFEPGFRVALHHKDLQICQAMAAALGAALPLVEMTLVHYRRLIEAGYGDEDISALLRTKRQLFDGSQHGPGR